MRGGGGFAPQPQPAASQNLRLDEIARALDHRTAAEVWQRFRAGERGVLGRHLYSHDGQATFDEISRRYDRDQDFRGEWSTAISATSSGCCARPK